MRRGGGNGTLGGAEAGAHPWLLGDQILRLGHSISSLGGAACRTVADGLQRVALFRLPPLRTVIRSVTSQEAGPEPLPGAGGAIGAGLAWELRWGAGGWTGASTTYAPGPWPVSGMACGATLKRPMEFEAALLSPGSPKRRRCAPLPGPTPGLRPPDVEPPPFQMQTPPPTLQQPVPPGSERRLPTPGNRRCGLGRKPGPGIWGVGVGMGGRVVDAGLICPRTPSLPCEKGTGAPPGPVVSGDGKHPGEVVGSQYRFSVFLELASLEGWATREKWEYPWPLRALRVPPAPPASAARACTEPPWKSVGPGKLDSTHEPSLEGGGWGLVTGKGPECVLFRTVL